MADLAYREVYAMNSIEARLRIVTTCHEAGTIRETARGADRDLTVLGRFQVRS